MSTFASLLRGFKGQHISEVIRPLSNACAHEFPLFSQISQLLCLFIIILPGSTMELDLAVGLAQLEKKFRKVCYFMHCRESRSRPL